MKVAVVITEYNPFHNGHKYQLDTIRNHHNADYIIVIMSGDFMQRGIPAIVSKYERCQMALANGADLVFELPVYFSLGSAEYFAQGAVSLADKLGVADFLHFGSESGDISLLKNCALIIAQESNEYKAALNCYLKAGNSFPAARSKAVMKQYSCNSLFSDDSQSIADSSDIEAVFSNPNNILGIEYIKALIQRNSAIKPVTLSRKGEGYSSDTLSSKSFVSANAIRTALEAADLASADLSMPANTDMHASHYMDIGKLQPHIPKSVHEILQNHFEAGGCFLFPNDFSEVLLYKLLQTAVLKNAFSSYYDVGNLLSHTIYNNLMDFTSFTDFAMLCKSKNLTYSRICRVLMHILLDMTQERANLLKNSDYSLYARLLGFTEHGQKLLKSIKANSSIPIITKPSKALKQLNVTALLSYRADLYAATIYESVKQQKQIRWSNNCKNKMNTLENPRLRNELTSEIVRLP